MPWGACAQDGDPALALKNLLNTRISTDAKYEQTSREAGASITIITAEDIERFGYRTLKDIFASVRGFYVSDDRNYAYVGIRELSRPTDYNNRVLLLLNGTTLNENVWASASIGPTLGLNLDAVERIEIVRGPGSALYGSSALFAVVNVITKTGNAVDGVRGAVEVGSFGSRTGKAMFGKSLANGMDLALAGQWSETDGQDHYYREFDRPETNNGIARDLDRDEHYGVTARITYGRFDLHGHFSSREKEIPTGVYGIDFNDGRSRTVDELGLVELRYERDFRADRMLMLRTYFNHYDGTGWYPYDGVLEAEDARGNWLGNELRYRWDTHAYNRLIVGVEYQEHFRAKYWVTEEEYGVYVEGSAPYHLLSFYVQDEYQITDRLALTLGARRDGYSTVGSSVNPRIALVYHLSESNTLKLLSGKAFRAPNVYESTYEEEGYARRNRDLGPEEIRTLEAIWEQKLNGSMFGTVVLYNNRLTDLIDWALDPSDGIGQYENSGKIDARGVELGLTVRQQSGLHGYVSYARQHAENAESNRKLNNFPSHLAKGGLSYPLSRSFSATSALQYESGRTTVYGTKTDPYLLTDIRLSTRIQPTPLRVSFAVGNLFGVTYSTPGGLDHRQAAITQDGRSYLVRIAFEL